MVHGVSLGVHLAVHNSAAFLAGKDDGVGRIDSSQCKQHGSHCA